MRSLDLNLTLSSPRCSMFMGYWAVHNVMHESLIHESLEGGGGGGDEIFIYEIFITPFVNA